LAPQMGETGVSRSHPFVEVGDENPRVLGPRGERSESWGVPLAPPSAMVGFASHSPLA